MSAVELHADPGVRVDELYRTYRQDVYRSLLRDLGTPADADDATQVVFLSAFRSLERGCRPHAARAWLLAIAKNVARKTWRERGRGDVELDPETIAAADPPDESRRELVAVLETLPTGQRTALVLHELCGLEYGEISHVTQQSVSGVETSVFRARQAVRTAMRDDGELGHAAATKLLKRLVTGKLTHHERESVQAHVMRCADCAEAETTLRQAKTRTRSRSRVLWWILSLPSGVQRLLGLVQTSPARGLGAVAFCAIGLATVAGDGPGRPDARPTTQEPATVQAAPRASVTAGRLQTAPSASVPVTTAPHRRPLASAPAKAAAGPHTRARAHTPSPSSGGSTERARDAAGPAPTARVAGSPPAVPTRTSGQPDDARPNTVRPAKPVGIPTPIPQLPAIDVGRPAVDGVLDLVEGGAGSLAGTGAAVTGSVVDTVDDVAVAAGATDPVAPPPVPPVLPVPPLLPG